jgi:uncharacterized protein YecE (DUF72 family)
MFYSERFDTVEINTTFYGQPRAEIAREWAARTPARFDFALKLYQKFTHPRMFADRELRKAPGASGSLLDWLATVTSSDIDEFRRGIDPLAMSGKVGVLLAQFPASFTATSRSIDYLDALLGAFHDFPIAVELRHRSWSDRQTETVTLLNAHNAALAQIDEPKFHSSIRQNELPNIKDHYYLRLHGRNAKAWWHHAHKDDRYNYLYSEDELGEVATVLTAVQQIVTRDVRAYLNNHYSAKAIANATTLKALVGQGLERIRPRHSVEDAR